MSKKALVPLNVLAKSSEPVGQRAGDLYFNTTDSTLYIYNGTAWAASSGGAGGGAGDGIASASSSAPGSPVDGQLWFNTVSMRLSVYSAGAANWIALANFADDLRQHVHDTAVDGTGLIVFVFEDAGFYDSTFIITADAGFYDTSSWTSSYDGGTPLDNISIIDAGFYGTDSWDSGYDGGSPTDNFN